MRQLVNPGGQSAVFFDRDGTLNRDDGYTWKPEDLAFLPGAVEAIRACNDAGVLAIVVTNQSGVARGKYALADMDAFHRHMQARLADAGAHIDAFYACPFHEGGVVAAFTRADHPDRKPNPGLIRRALMEWRIDPARAVMIGDQPRDVEAGRAAGVAAIAVKPGALRAAVTGALKKITTAEPTASPIAALKDRAAKARAWLFDSALPIWWARGFDRASGCFHELLGADGHPVAAPRRVRVQARQTYVYAAAGQLGWTGPWREAVEAGVRVLLDNAIRTDGGTAHRLDADGFAFDPRRDLYDTAFVIFALAHAAKALRQPALAETGGEVFDWVVANWSHPAGGFLEGEVVDASVRRQNPHMHLLEALLALHEATGAQRYIDEALKIVELFETRFVSAQHNALLEYFTDDWRPADGDAGAIGEPGHQFEWVWLIDRVSKASNHDARALARRLHIHGEVYGVAPETGVIADEVWVDGGVKTATSRFWPYTERLKANLVDFERTGDPQSCAQAIAAFDSLMAYCDVPTPGLWRDRRQANGQFADEPSPASTFYHAILAFSELIRVADGLP